MTDLRYWDWAQGTPRFTKDSAVLRAELSVAAKKELERVLLNEWLNPELGEPHD